MAYNNSSKDSNDNEDGEESRSLEKYNHHSFMNKARSERWSKAGTELFYQVCCMWYVVLLHILSRSCKNSNINGLWKPIKIDIFNGVEF